MVICLATYSRSFHSIEFSFAQQQQGVVRGLGIRATRLLATPCVFQTGFRTQTLQNQTRTSHSPPALSGKLEIVTKHTAHYVTAADAGLPACLQFPQPEPRRRKPAGRVRTAASQRRGHPGCRKCIQPAAASWAALPLQPPRSSRTQPPASPPRTWIPHPFPNCS